MYLFVTGESQDTKQIYGIDGQTPYICNVFIAITVDTAGAVTIIA